MTPREPRAQAVVFTREESSRVQRFVARFGIATAAKRLGVGEVTLDNARDQGRMQMKTRDRLLEALTREEAKAS